MTRGLTHDPCRYDGQFRFQRLYAVGSVLNVGSNTDGAGFRQKGGINLDLYAVDAVTGLSNPVHVLADARALPFAGHSFDSVVLGELLEHMEREAAVATLKEARRAARARVVITMPHDGRREQENSTEPALSPGKEMYAPGVYAYHPREISREELLGWVEEAGLRARLKADIHYVWGCEGTGLVAEC